MRFGAHLVDAARLAFRRSRCEAAASGIRTLACAAGRIRVFDSGPERHDSPVVVIAPDGPNAIEHYSELVRLLAGQLRVVVFDLPGFGRSYPSADFRFRLADGAKATLEVLDALDIRRATLAFPCANGFYAAAVARAAPDRVAALVLAQTPSYP
ncbi:MAG: alpha/beta hydrolase, partial [Gemmataceae bacterium]|nr:alpha/beta hydrolase [Gemmataceae bacterium]